MRQFISVAGALAALATLTLPGRGTPPLPARGQDFELLCSLYLDPHDAFTRVLESDASRQALRSSATLSNISVNYSGFSAEAQAAFREAIDIWLTQLPSPVPIVIDAQFLDLNDPLVLGHAGFRSLHFNFPGAPLTEVLYPGPIANRLSGVDRNGTQTEMVILLNSTPNWNFATDGVPVAGKIDFISAVLHELAHGFGHSGSANVSSTTGLGSWGISGRPYIYDTGVVDSAGFSILNGTRYPNGSTVLASLLKGTGLNGPGLFWIGSNGVTGNGGVRPRLYTPSTFIPGSSYSHLDHATYPPGDLNSLMTPSLATAEVIHTPGGILNGMLADMGWGSQCSYGLSPTLATIGTAGGQVSTTLSTSTGCPWNASTSSPFVTLVPPTGGTTSAVVRANVAANPGASARLATVQIADQTFTISQSGSTPCSFTLDPTSATAAGTGGSGTVQILTEAACAWTASVDPSQATITSALTGVGPAVVSYAIAANPLCAPRSITFTIAGQSFVVAQDPAPPTMTIDTTSLRFGAMASASAFASHTAPQIARLIQNGPGTVTWTAASSSPWLVVSPASGTGSATLSISTQFVPGLASTQTATVTLTYSGSSNASGTIASTLALVPTRAGAPFGSFDTPLQGATGVAGSIPVTGWALDDVEVTRVRIMRDPVGTEPTGTLVFIGDADLVEGARPDVQTQFPTLPRSSRAGWGYLMLTNFLPNLGNGTFRLTAIAEDGDGHSTVLGTKTITCSNATATEPFGAIDTPTQGGTVSGTVTNFGWVLAAFPRRADPPSGGGVRILVDGAFLPQVPAGWVPRADLTALFPADVYPGVANGLAVANIDTTEMTNGVHTIAWVVTDDIGAAAGVGSRYFTVANLSPPANAACAPQSSVIQASRLTSRVRGTSIQGRLGYRRDAAPRRFDADAQGRITIQSEEIDRIELDLGAGATGHLRVEGEARPLPAGSRIDPVTGAFTWQPGVGFHGVYDFDLAGHDVRIVLNPKASGRSGPQTVIDVPSAGAREVSSRSFVVAGWAADFDSSADAGVDVVHVWAYPIVDGRAADPIFLGAAPVAGVRPDVALVFGKRFEKSGFGLEVGSLAPGTYDLAVFAYSTVRGGFAPATTARITVR
jgi:hypothetical protein